MPEEKSKDPKADQAATRKQAILQFHDALGKGDKAEAKRINDANNLGFSEINFH